MRIGVRCLRRECLVSHTWRNGLLDGWSLHLRLSCSTCPPQKNCCASLLWLDIHFHPMRKCRQRLVARVFLLLLWLWKALLVDDLHMLPRWHRMVHIAVIQQTWLAKVSGLSPFWGRSLCLGGQREIFVSFLISILLVSIHLVLSTRPCSQRTVLMNLAIVFCHWASLGKYFHDGVLQCLGSDLWEPAVFEGCIVKLFTIMSSSASGLSVGARESASACGISFLGLYFIEKSCCWARSSKFWSRLGAFAPSGRLIQVTCNMVAAVGWNTSLQLPKTEQAVFFLVFIYVHFLRLSGTHMRTA